MAIQHNQESEYAKEAVKWEAYPTALGPGLRPYVKREFPAWIYKATREPNGAVTLESQQVESELQLGNMRSRGWSLDPDAAHEALNAAQLEHAKLAANLEHQKTTMGQQAVAEIETAQAEHSGHMPVMPETPIVPRRK